MKKYLWILLLLLVCIPVLAYEGISVAPLNASKCDINVGTGGKALSGNCTYIDTENTCQEGIITYQKLAEDDSFDYMMINSKELVNKYGTKLHKEGLADVEAYLSGQQNETDKFRYLFEDCTDYGCEYASEIKGLSYPGMDQVRAFFTLDSQNPPWANIVIRVLARKGDNYIMLVGSTPLATSNADGSSRPLFKKCLNKYGDDNDKEVTACYIKALETDQEVQRILKSRTEDLLKFFAI